MCCSVCHSILPTISAFAHRLMLSGFFFVSLSSIPKSTTPLTTTLREPEKIFPNRKGKKKRSITRKRDCSERDKEKKPAIQLIIANRRGDREREKCILTENERERENRTVDNSEGKRQEKRQ